MHRKILTANILKIIGIISMVIDHIGLVFFPEIIIFRIIGRLAFPIFAFAVAEGYSKTHSKAKYALRMLIFALISTYPFLLIAPDGLTLNIMYTFLFSIGVMYLYDKLQQAKADYNTNSVEPKSIGSQNILLYSVAFYGALIFVIAFTITVPTDYYFYGVFSVLIFYVYRGSFLKQALYFSVITIGFCLVTIVPEQSFMLNILQCFSLLSLPILYFYNGKRGKLNLKYLFYIFYPLQFIVLYIVKILI